MTGYKFSKKPVDLLPEGHVPPMPYADICPLCKNAHKRNVFTFRETPKGRHFGYFCAECEKIPPWQKTGT